jgi:dolichol-phosphate mannosyltransferase
MTDAADLPGGWADAGVANLLSVVVPAQNELENLESMIVALHDTLVQADISHEILVVDDHSTDGTDEELKRLAARIPVLRYIYNPFESGYGLAVRAGLHEFRGDRVAIMMADGSDNPDDLVAFCRKMDEGYDCVFGSRFTRTSKVIDYPVHKLILNRIANNLIRFLFRIRYNDTTNAFKCYRRTVIAGIQPILSHHFNLTVELPLKAIIRGYSYAEVPNDWHNRKTGISKLRIGEMGSRYLFIILYCLIERHLSRGDYDRGKADG